MERGKGAAALIIELARRKEKEPEEKEEKGDYAAIAEELMSMAKEEDAEGFAMALKDFVQMCIEESK